MYRAVTAALLLGLALLANPAAAQVAGAGSKQITFGGGGLVGGDFQSLNATVGLTKYVSDHLEIGGFLNGSLSKMEGSDSEISGYVFGNATWNFVSQSMTVPFVFFGAGTPLDDDTIGDLAFQGGAGFKRFVNEDFSFNGQVSGIGQMYDGEFEMAEFVLVTFGFSYYIR